MPTIKIERKLDMTVEQVKEVADKIAEKLSREYGVSFDWSGNCAKLNGSGLNGSCTVEDRAITIELNLGFLLKPFAPRIEEAVNRYLDKLA